MSSFTDYVLGRGVYQFVAAVFATLSTMNVFFNTCFCRWFYGAALTPPIDLGFRVLGAMMIVIAAVSYSLQAAVKANRMNELVYKRLALALTITLAGMCYCKVPYILEGNPMAAQGTYGSSVLQLLPCIAFFKIYGLKTLPEIIPGVIASVRSMSKPKNFTAALYSFLSVGLTIEAMTSVFNPARVVSIMFGESAGPFFLFQFRVSGFMKYLMSVVCLTLKEAADRGYVGDSPFRLLNLSLCFAAAANLIRVAYAETVGIAAVGAKPVGLLPAAWFSLVALFGTMALVSGLNAVRTGKKCSTSVSTSSKVS